MRRTSLARPASRGWRGDSYAHALARAGVKTKQKPSKVSVDFDKAYLRRRGKVYEVDLRNESIEPEKQKREVGRLKKMSLAEIKKRYGAREKE